MASELTRREARLHEAMYDLAGERHTFISVEEGKEPRTVLDVSFRIIIRFMPRRPDQLTVRSAPASASGPSPKLYSGGTRNSSDSILSLAS